MTFLYEKQARRFFGFLAAMCVLQGCILAFGGFLQIRGIREALVEQEKRASSYLLEEEVPPAVVAGAWNCMRVTAEGERLLEQIGHTEKTEGYLVFLAEQTAAPLVTLSLSGTALFALILLTGAGYYLQRRECMYENAERIVSQYAEDQFDVHLPGERNGAIYHLFGRVEQLALSLRAKSETEHKAKEFLKNVISDISHQLKTPLAALNMYMEILLEEPEDAEVVREFSRKSMQSLERMEQLIQSLIKIARLDTGSIVFEKRMNGVSELVFQAVQEFRERANQEKKSIVAEGEPEEMIFCDFEWTKEAIANLVKNGLDHTAEGGVIRILWRRSPAMLRLTVEDNGNGIAPEDIHHIFKRFYRSRRSVDRQGAGLGLSLAKAIIEGQEGVLSVESSLDKGTAFHISFLNGL